MADSHEPLLRVVVHEPGSLPSLMALCAGYESEAWRAEALAREISAWLPSFALPWSEQQQLLGSRNAVRLLRRAAEVVYETDKYSRRGEFGELLLHGVLLQEYKTTAAVSKLWFKDAKNDTVKGFDVIHITDEAEERLHLWLGEAKFYKDLRKAVADALNELERHLEQDYLRSEFMLVSNKIDPLAPFADRLKRLLDENTSLDDVFSVLHIPVLLTFNSKAVADHKRHCDEYFAQLRDEVQSAWEAFSAKVGMFGEVVVHLILVPVLNKNALTDLLHERLRAWQAI